MDKMVNLAEVLIRETDKGVISWEEIDEGAQDSEFRVKIGYNNIVIKSYFDEVQELNKTAILGC